ncbi:hypothetical protein [Jannaschia sp. LMIT008]|uniref:hypothetical protein n=1 Tax=Jannaschia maritima TaxID=3032585 RepID=UPI002810C68B|nr:hypothetical protein [Jannaschia sp. LMIT008]
MLAIGLAACAADLPPAEGSVSRAALDAPPPRLAPLDPLLGALDAPVRAQAAGASLDRQGDVLRGARIGVPGDADLDARGAALRRRADALRRAEVE